MSADELRTTPRAIRYTELLLRSLRPPEPRGARVVTFGPPLTPDTDDRKKARERWREMKTEWNRRRKARGWPK
jgi:hypothetical protein